MMHELKIMEGFADEVCRGCKTFEVRREDDRRFEVGDKVRFRVVDADGADVPSHALNRRPYAVTYVLRGWGVADGYAAIAIKPRGIAVFDRAADRSAEWAAAPMLELGA